VGKSNAGSGDSLDRSISRIGHKMRGICLRTCFENGATAGLPSSAENHQKCHLVCLRHPDDSAIQSMTNGSACSAESSGLPDLSVSICVHLWFPSSVSSVVKTSPKHSGGRCPPYVSSGWNSSCLPPRIRRRGFSRTTVVLDSTGCVSQTFDPITESWPITVCPPNSVALA